MKTIESVELLETKTRDQSLADAIIAADFHYIVMNALGVILACIVAVMLGRYDVLTPREAGVLFMCSIPIAMIAFQYYSVQYKNVLLAEHNISLDNKEIRWNVWVVITASSIVIGALLVINSKIDMSTLFVWAVVYPVVVLLPKVSRYFFIKQAMKKGA